MVTKGTFKDPQNLSYEPRYVLSVKAERMNAIKSSNPNMCLQIGVTFFDVSTLKIYIGQFEDDN